MQVFINCHTGVLDVRTTAKIDQSTVTVHSALLASNQLVDIVQFIFAVPEHLLQVLL